MIGNDSENYPTHLIITILYFNKFYRTIILIYFNSSEVQTVNVTTAPHSVIHYFDKF